MKATKQTITRTVLLAFALVNQILAITGHSMILIEDNTIADLISTAFTITTALYAWWKNNSFTDEAIEADRYMNNLKSK